MAAYLTTVFQLLSSYSAEEISAINKEYDAVLSDKEKLFELIEELYNYWRRFERFIYMEAPQRSKYAKQSFHHAQFIKSNEEFKNLVLHAVPPHQRKPDRQESAGVPPASCRRQHGHAAGKGCLELS